jgi:hypothetical protein
MSRSPKWPFAHCISVTKTNCLSTFTEIIAVYSEEIIRNTDISCMHVQLACLQYVKADVMHGNCCEFKRFYMLADIVICFT